MQIQVDTREHASEWERISKQFDELEVKYFRSKLFVGDYMSLDNPRLVIDRKRDLLEICGNVTQQHERFKAELLRAMEQEIQIVILCEHGDGIEKLEDVVFWENPRKDMWRWTTQNGIRKRVKAYPKATSGEALYKSLCTIRDRYNVRIEFCDKAETGRRIVEILGGKA